MRAGRRLDFDGAMLIHPKQIATAKRDFAPSEQELAWARRVIEVFDATMGVGQLDGKMIDRPFWLRAMRFVQGTDEVR